MVINNGELSMSRKIILSIGLVGLGVISGALVIFVYSLTGGDPTITLITLGLAIASIITGTILAFSQLLDRFFNPVIEEVGKGIEDDIQDIKAGQIKDVLIMAVITGVAVLVFFYLILRFHKLEARWGSIPVILPTLVAVAALAWFIPRTRWFQYKILYTPLWVFLIPTAGLILSLVVGINKTEDPQIFNSRSLETIQYNTYPVSNFIFQTALENGDLGFSLDLPSCDGDDCEVFYLVLLVIGLIILTLILLAGSAMIPHFWLFGGSILIGLMAIITLHDLLIRPKEIAQSDD
jgi:uncharacterized protein (DUF983 family)